jgi:hypothetical protein
VGLRRVFEHGDAVLFSEREDRGHVRAAFALRFDPNGSEIIANATAGSADGTAGQYTGSSTVGASIELVCLTAGRWEVQSVKGTWVLA